jgi:signal transduction histidine kinase/CheY-like chemotaxis protein
MDPWELEDWEYPDYNPSVTERTASRNYYRESKTNATPTTKTQKFSKTVGITDSKALNRGTKRPLWRRIKSKFRIKKCRLSFRATLLLICLIQIATSIALFYLGYFYSRTSTDVLSATLRGQILDNLYHHVIFNLQGTANSVEDLYHGLDLTFHGELGSATQLSSYPGFLYNVMQQVGQNVVQEVGFATANGLLLTACATNSTHRYSLIDGIFSPNAQIFDVPVLPVAGIHNFTMDADFNLDKIDRALDFPVNVSLAQLQQYNTMNSTRWDPRQLSYYTNPSLYDGLISFSPPYHGDSDNFTVNLMVTKAKYNDLALSTGNYSLSNIQYITFATSNLSHLNYELEALQNFGAGRVGSILLNSVGSVLIMTGPLKELCQGYDFVSHRNMLREQLIQFGVLDGNTGLFAPELADQPFSIYETSFHLTGKRVRARGLEAFFIVLSRDGDFLTVASTNNNKIFVLAFALLAAIALFLVGIAQCLSRPILTMVKFMTMLSSVTKRAGMAPNTNNAYKANNNHNNINNHGSAANGKGIGAELAHASGQPSSQSAATNVPSRPPKLEQLEFYQQIKQVQLSWKKEVMAFSDWGENPGQKSSNNDPKQGGNPFSGLKTPINSNLPTNSSNVKRAKEKQVVPLSPKAKSTSQLASPGFRANSAALPLQSNNLVPSTADNSASSSSKYVIPASNSITNEVSSAPRPLHNNLTINTALMPSQTAQSSVSSAASSNFCSNLWRNCAFYKRLMNFGTKFLMEEVSTMQLAFNSMLERLSKSYEMLDKANSAKQNFVRYIFHEVRVPLNAIMLGLNELQELAGFNEAEISTVSTSQDSVKSLPLKQTPGRWSVEQQELVSLVVQQSQVVARILNDVLSLSKIEDGALQLQYGNFSLHSMILSTMQSFRAAAAAKSIHYTANLHSLQDFMFGIENYDLRPIPGVDSRPKVDVLGDKHRLVQVLSNFLSNAIKFTPNNGVIQINLAISPPVNPAVSSRNDDHADAEQLDSSGALTGDNLYRLPYPRATFRVSVIDSGVGISPENQQKLFQPYMQILPGSQQQGKGTGLGLNISKSLIELHGGRIGYQSPASGVGSEFFFELELQAQLRGDGFRNYDSALLGHNTQPIMKYEANSKEATAPPNNRLTIHIDSGSNAQPGSVGANSGGLASNLNELYLETPHLRHLPRRNSTKSIVSNTPFDFNPVTTNSNTVNNTAEALQPHKRHGSNLLPTRSGANAGSANFNDNNQPIIILPAAPILSSASTSPAALIANNYNYQLNHNLWINTNNTLSSSSPTTPSQPEIPSNKFASGSASPYPTTAFSPPSNMVSPAPAADTSAPRKVARILVVEDSSPNRKLLLMLLKRLKYECVGVENGEEAVNQFKEYYSNLIHASAENERLSVHNGILPGVAMESEESKCDSGENSAHPVPAVCPYDLILMDGNMPIKDGKTATAELRTMNVTIPIIAVTGNAMSEDVAQFLAAGANDLLTKPINEKQLKSVLNNYLPSHQVTPSTNPPANNYTKQYR